MPCGISPADTDATLTASINPNSLATTYRFEWGPTDTYGTSVPAPDEALGSGNTYIEVSKVPLKGLTPNTTYHYRVVAENPAGVTSSGDRTLVTNTSGYTPET